MAARKPSQRRLSPSRQRDPWGSVRAPCLLSSRKSAAFDRVRVEADCRPPNIDSEARSFGGKGHQICQKPGSVGSCWLQVRSSMGLERLLAMTGQLGLMGGGVQLGEGGSHIFCSLTFWVK